MLWNPTRTDSSQQEPSAHTEVCVNLLRDNASDRASVGSVGVENLDIHPPPTPRRKVQRDVHPGGANTSTVAEKRSAACDVLPVVRVMTWGAGICRIRGRCWMMRPPETLPNGRVFTLQRCCITGGESALPLDDLKRRRRGRRARPGNPIRIGSRDFSIENVESFGDIGMSKIRAFPSALRTCNTVRSPTALLLKARSR